jgi:hypothetical protein
MIVCSVTVDHKEANWPSWQSYLKNLTPTRATGWTGSLEYIFVEFSMYHDRQKLRNLLKTYYGWMFRGREPDIDHELDTTNLFDILDTYSCYAIEGQFGVHFLGRCKTKWRYRESLFTWGIPKK